MKRVFSFGEKEGAPKSHQKVSKNKQGLFTHGYIYLFYFLPSYLLARTVFRTECFGFALLKEKAVMWLRDAVLEKETQLKIATQAQAPEHIPWMSIPTDLSRTLAQVPAYLTA